MKSITVSVVCKMSAFLSVSQTRHLLVIRAALDETVRKASFVPQMCVQEKDIQLQDDNSILPIMFLHVVPFRSDCSSWMSASL